VYSVYNVHDGSQAKEKNVKVGSFLLKCNGVTLESDMDLALMISTAKTSITNSSANGSSGSSTKTTLIKLTFAAPGTWGGTAQEKKAAAKLGAIMRGRIARKRGPETTIEFNNGALGMQFHNLVITKVESKGQASEKGVIKGSVVLRINGKRLQNDMTFVTELKLALKVRTVALRHTLNDMRPHSRTHALSHSRTHALTHSRTHALTLSRTHALTLSYDRTIILSLVML
jgi:S1-C subfamily serine protease